MLFPLALLAAVLPGSQEAGWHAGGPPRRLTRCQRCLNREREVSSGQVSGRPCWPGEERGQMGPSAFPYSPPLISPTEAKNPVSLSQKPIKPHTRFLPWGLL